GPPPDAGGIALVAVTTIVVAAAGVFFAKQFVGDAGGIAVVFASAIGLALVGVTDDLRPLDAIPRLLLQTLAVAAVSATLPVEMRFVPAVPWWLDRALLLIGGVWLVHVVNFIV